MLPEKVNNLQLADGELFVHDGSDLVDYDQFFEFFIANGEMAGRVDALHSQHLRDGAKKDVLCVRAVDLWGERTYPVHRGRPAGRFVSKLVGPDGNEVQIDDITTYRQALNTANGVLDTTYDWRRDEAAGHNSSTGFMSKKRKHLMAHRYIDTVQTTGWKRSFRVETLFPYHSRASAFYFKRPYGPKKWAWGEVEHEYPIEPEPNATVRLDEGSHEGIVTFSTTHPGLATKVAWCIRPLTPPDRWIIDEEHGAISLEWDLKPGAEQRSTLLMSIVTDRDSVDYVQLAQSTADSAVTTGWDGIESEHKEWWKNEFAKSTITLPDPRLQRLYDISILYMLQNSGGSYLPFIGIDDVIYETCMCDNLVMLHSLVETNHLEIAQDEFELLHTYLPAARKNARDRMNVVLGIDNEEAALVPFYMTEDGIELWQDNVFGMYTSMSAYHSASLLKIESYRESDEFLRNGVYPWLRAYAEYGRLHAVWAEDREAYIFPIHHLGGGGEGYWHKQTMTNELYWRIFARSDPMFRFADFPPIEWMPVDEISKLDGNWIDVVANFRWILRRAAALADRLELDSDLREQWRDIARKIDVPQNDSHYLSHIGPDATPGLGGPAVGSVFWPAEGTYEELDARKLARTLAVITSKRYVDGEREVRNPGWGALNGFDYAYTGDGEEALRFLTDFGAAADHRGIEGRESVKRQNYYYLLNQGTMILLTRSMLLQTYNGMIRVFPAVPAEWIQGGVSFAGLPGERGLLVDGTLARDGGVVTIRSRSGESILSFAGAVAGLQVTPMELWDPPNRLEFELSGVSTSIRISSLESGDRGITDVIVNGESQRVGGDPTSISVEPPARVLIEMSSVDAKR